VEFDQPPDRHRQIDSVPTSVTGCGTNPSRVYRRDGCSLGVRAARGHCDAGLLRSRTTQHVVHPGVRRIVRPRFPIRVSSRCMAVRAGRGHLGDGGVAPLALRSGSRPPALSASVLINRGWAWPKRPSWKSSHGCPVRPRRKGSMFSPGMALISVRSYRPRSAGFPAGLLLPRSQNRTPDGRSRSDLQLASARRPDHDLRATDRAAVGRNPGSASAMSSISVSIPMRRRCPTKPRASAGLAWSTSTSRSISRTRPSRISSNSAPSWNS
jgi:hypothetical protein